jgi:hypothetical protein
MSEDRGYIAENTAQRTRLRALVERLSDDELARPLPAGWTIAGVLAHLAFWDRRVLALLERWEHQPGWAPPLLDGADVDWINDAAKALCLALPPRAAARLAVVTAEAVDRRVAVLADAQLAANAAAGGPVTLRRAEHRKEHLDEIEAALAGR